MLVQRVAPSGSGLESWTVLGDDDCPIWPVERYLSYLSGIERSPNTVRASVWTPSSAHQRLPLEAETVRRWRAQRKRRRCGIAGRRGGDVSREWSRTR